MLETQKVLNQYLSNSEIMLISQSKVEISNVVTLEGPSGLPNLLLSQ